jgi:hypothetical protein
MQQAERAARTLASPFTLATALNMQASLALAADEDRAAAAFLLEAADLAAAAGTTWTLVYTLPALAVIAARGGQPGTAAELFAAGSTTAEVAALAVSFPPDLQGARHWLHAVQVQLGPEAFDRAWDAGRRMTPVDVPEVARGIIGSL